MNRRSISTAAIAALMLLTSLGTVVTADHGKWLAATGAYEPNTRWDTAAFMFQDANQEAVDKVYFNGVITHFYGFSAGVTLATNVDGGSQMGVLANRAQAVLGYWRDCNKDGYIGARYLPTYYGSFSQYPRSLVSIDTTICPPGSPYNPTNSVTGQPDGMIDEFRWIGWNAGCDSFEPGCPGNPIPDPKVCVGTTGVCVTRTSDAAGDYNGVTDNRSRVWGDWNHPGGVAIPSQGLAPLPRGTLMDSDGTLGYIDDATIKTISTTAPAAWAAKPNVGACDQPHPTFLGGPQGTCGLWPAYQAKRLFNDSTCYQEDPAKGRPTGCSKPDSLVSTWDYNEAGDRENPCDGGFRTQIDNDPTNQNKPRVVAIPGVKVGVNPNLLADGSVVGTLRHQQRALNATTGGEGKCGRTHTLAASTCAVGSELECESQNTKFEHVAPDFVFAFAGNHTTRRTLASFGFEAISQENLGLGGPGGLNSASPIWNSNIIWTNRFPRLGWGHVSNAYATFYADVTNEGIERAGASAATALPGKEQDKYTYGTDYCPALTTGASNVNPVTMWECSITVWEDQANSQNTPGNARLGFKYDLRDVDCMDNTIAERHTGDLKAGIADCAADHK